uniref:Uncharacterized protein n=1 Tax=Tanacetum cinerariifolium TaxID=118510 RepID=A0A6L2P800_TANCI|nr:hypothetical protein [Tanacetum cinerariifolium]
MVVQNQTKLGEGSTILTDPHYKPTILQPSSSQPQKTHKPRKLKRKDTQVLVSGAKKPWGILLLKLGLRVYLNILMIHCLHENKVLDLEKTKTTQSNEIDSLKRRVKKLEKRNRSRTHKLKRLYKVGLTARVESSGDEESLDDLGGEEVFVAEQEVVKDVNKNVVKEIVKAAQDSTATTTITTEKITLAQALKALKTLKPKVKWIVIQEQEELGEELIQESTKKQKVEDYKETTELKHLMEIIPDKEEVAIDAIPLAVKSPRIVDWKIHKEGKKSYYQIVRADGKSQMYMVYMLVEKTYPLTPPTLLMMLKKQLQIDYPSEMAYQLLKLIKKQLKK